MLFPHSCTTPGAGPTSLAALVLTAISPVGASTATSATTSASALVSPFQLCCCSSLALVFPAVTDPDAISSPASPVLLLLLHLGFAGPNPSLTLESPT